MPPDREIRAAFTPAELTVYQAFSPEIAEPAVRDGRFGAGFSMSRMTWIKPSFLWMMGRSGWASKPGQERVLAIEITREGFEWALAHACLSHFDPGFHASRDEWTLQVATSPVRIQWDPERSLTLEKLPWRSIQVGLSGEAVQRYVAGWIVAIRDVTQLAHAIREAVVRGDRAAAETLLPVERPWPVPTALRRPIGLRD